MHRRFLRQSGLASHQIVVEEAQHFAKDGESRLDRVAERRDVGARAMVPRPEQQCWRLFGSERNRAIAPLAKPAPSIQPAIE